MLPVNHWRQLETLLSYSPEHASLLLQSPCHSLPPDLPCYLRLEQKAAKVHLTQLLRKHMLTSMAFNDSMDEAQALMLARILQEYCEVSLLPPNNRIQWIVFPVPVTRGSNGRIMQILLGHCSDGSSRIDARQMSPDSLAAVAEARDALSTLDTEANGTLILLPLLPDDSRPLTGRSLGLPCAIALHLLTDKLQWPGGLLATGRLAADGRVHSVSGLKEKQAAMQDIRCFIVPENETVADCGNAIGCYTLNQAIDAVDLFSLATTPEQINRYRHSLTDPKHFLDHFHELPLPFLTMEKCKQYILRMSAQPHIYLENAAKKLHTCTCDPPRGVILATLYTAEQLANAVETEPKMLRHVINWCVGRLAYANHSGETSGVDTWLRLHDRLQTEMPVEELLESLNHRFITTRLNRYVFSPKIPPPIAALLEEEAGKKASCKANRHVGAMYGTLAQNCGFCGPDYFDQLDSYSAMAERAFSRIYSDECRRLQVYRLYGLLDREEIGRIADLLNPYLDLPHSAEPSQWLTEAAKRIASKNNDDHYTALLTLRTVADLVELGKILPALSLAETIGTLPRIGSMRMHHPWQLIAFNMARLFLSHNLRAQAVSLFEQSIAICRRGCETMQAMALLGYAELHKHSLADKIHYREAGQVLQHIETSRYLNREHFSPLQGYSIADALEKVADNKRRFFPFSYR